MSSSSHPISHRIAGMALILAATLSAHGLAQARVAEKDPLPCRSSYLTRMLAKASAGDYLLDNGQSLKLKAQGCQLLASFDDRPDALLYEYSQGQWRSQDGSIDLNIESGRSGWVSGVKLNMAKLSR